jgi:hypothetical protein
MPTPRERHASDANANDASTKRAAHEPKVSRAGNPGEPSHGERHLPSGCRGMDAPTTRVHHEGIFKKRLCIPGERLTNPVNHQAIRNLQQFLPDGRLAFIGADQRLQIQENGVFRASSAPWNT